MKKLLLTLCLTSLLGASHCWAAEQAVDSDDLKSPDQVADKNYDTKVPGEANAQEGQANELRAMCDGGACPR